MKHHTARLYVASATLLVFFLLWATIAAKPWASPSKQAADPRVVALQARQRALEREAAHVKAVVASRWHRYEEALRSRERQIAAAKRRHDEQVAASRAAYAQLAAYRARSTAAASAVQTVTTTVVSHSTSAASAPPPPAPAPAPPPPPPVQVVTLPPVTGTSSSKRP